MVLHFILDLSNCKFEDFIAQGSMLFRFNCFGSIGLGFFVCSVLSQQSAHIYSLAGAARLAGDPRGGVECLPLL